MNIAVVGPLYCRITYALGRSCSNSNLQNWKKERKKEFEHNFRLGIQNEYCKCFF